MGDVMLFGAIRSKITKPGGASMEDQDGVGFSGGQTCAGSTGGRSSSQSDIVGSSGWSDAVGVVVEVSAMFAVAVNVMHSWHSHSAEANRG
jgi:hypothetical protein